MKILHVGKFYPPENGGIESVVYECVEGLKSNSQFTDVICATNRTDLSFTENKSGCNIFRCPSYGTVLRNSLSPQYLAKLRHIARQYDVISIHLPNLLPLLAFTGLNNLPPLILHWHADVSNYGLAYRPYSIFERILLDKCFAIVVATDAHFTTSPILQKYKSKIKVIPYGINTCALISGMPVQVPILQQLSGKNIVFSLGRFVAYKGFDVLIRAAAKLPDDYVVIIGGDGPLKKSLDALLVDLGLSSKVKLVGRIPDNELGAYYQACKVFCLPSVTQAEAFGVVLIEAMSFGKPVVATRLGNGVEWVAGHGESGITVPIGDPLAMADAIQLMVSDEDRYEKYSYKAKARFTTEFTSDIMINRLLQLYRDATNA